MATIISNFGKAIYNILTGSTGVTNYVQTKIYPVIVPQEQTEVKLPVVIYERQTTLDYTKDFYTSSDSNLAISIISDDYAESLDIAEAINSALNNYSGTVQNVKFKNIRLTDIDEVAVDDTYIQKLVYSVKAV